MRILEGIIYLRFLSFFFVSLNIFYVSISGFSGVSCFACYFGSDGCFYC